jgi:CBS domain-containing protein
MPISEYCRTDPVTGAPGDSVQEAAKRMDAAGVGCLVVVDEARRPLGMLTDRDIALRVLRSRLDPTRATVGDLMNAPAVTVSDRAPVAVAARFMRANGLRRIPVIDHRDGTLLGIVASDDLLQLIASELASCAEVARRQFPADLAGDHALGRGGQV